MNAISTPQTASGAEEAAISPEALYRIYRGYLEHEDGLIDQRVKSGLAVHGFLFAFYGATLLKLADATHAAGPAATDGRSLRIAALAHDAVFVIGGVGVLSALITMASVAAAATAMLRLSHTWEMRMGARADAAGLPHLVGGGDRVATVLGFGTTLALPALIVLSWIAAGVVGWWALTR